jgi:hypothetical protein
MTKNGARYVVLLYRADRYTGDLRSSEEGRVFWMPRRELDHCPQPRSFREMVMVMESEQPKELYCPEAFGQWEILSFTADRFFAVPEKSDLKVEFIGSSAAAGYGVSGTPGLEGSVSNSDCSKAYTYVAAQELGADYSIIAGEGIAVTVNFWSSFNMETLYNWVSCNKKELYDFDFNPDVVVVDLGTVESSYISRPHDGDPNYGPDFSGDYKRFIEQVREKNPDTYIICLYGMMNQNVAIRNSIRLALEEINDEKIVFNPFEIEGNNDGAINHPNAAAQKTWGEDLAAYIRSLGL